MKRIALLLLVCIPAPSIGASFDCEKASSLPEMMICNDKELSVLDEELAAIYKQAKNQTKNKAQFKTQTTAAWNWRERNCHDKDCLLNWYAQRKITLNKIVSGDQEKNCHSTGDIRLKGVITSETFTLEPDNRLSTAYVLNTEKPVCVLIEPMDIGDVREEMTNRFHLTDNNENVSYETIKNNAFSKVVIEGSLSTDGITQYYVERNHIKVNKITPVENTN